MTKNYLNSVPQVISSHLRPIPGLKVNVYNDDGLLKTASIKNRSSKIGSASKMAFYFNVMLISNNLALNIEIWHSKTAAYH